MKIKKDAEAIYTSDFFYDLFLGGYIDPDDLLEKEDAKKVKDAMALIEEFCETLEEHDLIEYG